MELIREFAKLGKDDARIAGGKGASLGEMTQAGIPVPPGYVILNSLVVMYPELRGCEQGILRHEIARPPEIEILKARKENFVIVGEHTAFRGSLQQFAKQNTHLEFQQEYANRASDELKGQVANGGYGRGRVRILKRKEQVSKLIEGEVLVSTMTTPDFIPAMKKAAAIVTDEGGLLCHAAITSRELHKPCLIGTKIATQVFKTGEMVEVDAEEGIVRKI